MKMEQKQRIELMQGLALSALIGFFIGCLVVISLVFSPLKFSQKEVKELQSAAEKCYAGQLQTNDNIRVIANGNTVDVYATDKPFYESIQFVFVDGCVESIKTGRININGFVYSPILMAIAAIVASTFFILYNVLLRFVYKIRGY